MGFYYWFRVALMIASLVGVIWVMRSLERGQIIPTGAESAALKINLCPTRINSMEATAGLKVLQEGFKWFREQNGERAELKPIPIEKWFSEYCSLRVEPVESTAALAPFMTFSYVKGASRELMKSPAGEYQWEGQTFRSPKLDTAVEALTQLPEGSGH